MKRRREGGWIGQIGQISRRTIGSREAERERMHAGGIELDNREPGLALQTEGEKGWELWNFGFFFCRRVCRSKKADNVVMSERRQS